MKKCVVFLPVYNGERFLKETIESVMNQSYNNFDLVIYNDGSTDGSFNIIKIYMKNKNIVYVDGKINKGTGHALAFMFNKYSQYKYVCMIGQDDIYSHDFLESQIQSLTSSKAVVTFSKVKYINQNNEDIKLNLYHHDIINTEKGDNLLLTLINGNHFCASSSMINRKKCKNFIHLGFNNDRLQDHELWLNLSIAGDFNYNIETYVKYRKHDNNLSNPNKLIKQNMYEYYDMLDSFLFNDNFNNYLNTINKDKLCGKIAFILYNLIPSYGYPLLLTTLKFCEKMLSNKQINNDKIKLVLSYCYLDCGMLNKYYKFSNYKKILYPKYNNLNKEEINLIEKITIFETNLEYAKNCNLKSIEIYSDTDNMISRKYPCITIGKKPKNCNSNILYLNTWKNANEKILNFIENHTNIYGNNLFEDSKN